MTASKNEISADVCRFIREHIPSVERLEILLHLIGHQHGCTVRDIQHQIQTSEQSVRANISALVAAGLAAQEGGLDAAVQYRPASRRAEAIVHALAAVYRTRRVSIIELIYADLAIDGHPAPDAVRRKPR